MMSAIPTTPPLPPPKNTPPRHGSSGSRIQEDGIDGSILNRMREVVMTHYRNSPSAPDRPIDLTHFKETSKTLTTSSTTSNNATTMRADLPPSIPMPTHDNDNDDDDEDYVPPGLADFVANVNRELEQQQQAFLNDPSNISAVERGDAKDGFYAREYQTFERAPTDEHNNENTDEESTKLALKRDILQRCDLLQLDGVLSDDNEEYIENYPTSHIDHALTWSPDIFTSPTPINPASLLSFSQMKQQVFTSPLMTPIPAPSNHASQAAKSTKQALIIQEEEPTSPLQSLPHFTLSETNRFKKSSPAKTKDVGTNSNIGKDLHISDQALPHSRENIRLLSGENDAPASSMTFATDQMSSVGQEILLVEEATTLSLYQPHHSPPPDHVTTSLDVAMHQLDVANSIDEEDIAKQSDLTSSSATQDTPSTLSMASPSKGMPMSEDHLFSQTQSIGHRAVSPIYGYAPAPENNSGMLNGFSSPTLPPPPPPHVSQKLLTVQGQLRETIRASPGPLRVNEMTQRKPQSPSSGSFLQRATQKLLSVSSADGSETKQSRAVPIPSSAMTDVELSHPIEHAASLDEAKAMAPSPKQKFTNRPPQNKPITTPSPLPTGNSILKVELATVESSKDFQSASQSVRDYTSPQKISASPSCAVSETPSPLSMSSPGGHDTRSAFVPSSSTRKSDKNGVSTMVPRFRTPPSPPRIKTAPRFTAEAADRLSRPSKSPQPPTASKNRSVPHYATPLKKSGKFDKSVPSAIISSQAMRASPIISPPVSSRASIPLDVTMNVSAKKLSISSINRLSTPSSTESRRRSLVQHNASLKNTQSTRKSLTSPPLIPSSHGRTISVETREANTIDAKSGPTSRRRSMERVIRNKSLKSVGRISPLIGLPPSSPNKALERNPSVDAANGKATPTSELQSTPSYKLSSGFEKSFRLSASNSIHDKSVSNSVQPSPSKSKCSEIIDRLSRPTQTRAIAINCTLNPPPADDEKEVQIPVVVKRSPSPLVLTTIDRLAKPTFARKAAIKDLGNIPPKQSTTSRSTIIGKESYRPGAKNSVSTSLNQSPKLPSRLDSSSHLLAGTVVSKAKKALPKKAIIRPPTPTRYVSGASDRLTKPTASYRALILPKPDKVKSPSIRGSIMKSETSNNSHREERRPASTVESTSHSLARPLTVPRGPRCANLPPSNKQQRNKECIESPSLAQVLDTFGKGLRDDFSVGSASSNFSRRSLTIPTGPKLATDIRGGEKYKPPKINSDVSLADSNAVLQHGLRSPYRSKQSRHRRGPTIPVSPKFSVLPSREPLKSKSELEAEELKYSMDHQFKAKPPLHSAMQSNYHSSSFVSRQNSKDVPGYMRPTKVTTLNSKKSDASIVAQRHRRTGFPNSIIVPDDGLKGLLEQAARAAKALAIREEARQEKLVMEELERRELASFKAKPVPRSTYEHNPIVPTSTAPLVDPFSPELRTKQRMKERKAFDDYAEQERLSRLEHIREMEDRRQADEDEEINERRRLPVSEGGMIPVAAPINAVLWNE